MAGWRGNRWRSPMSVPAPCVSDYYSFMPYMSGRNFIGCDEQSIWPDREINTNENALLLPKYGKRSQQRRNRVSVVSLDR